MGKQDVFTAVEAERDRLFDLATQLWENPELSLQEVESAAVLKGALREAGFDIESGVARMETAFIATYGDGGPVVGVIGEYDALPDISQKAKAEREPVEEAAPGHGCGHNLFGVGSLGAAIGTKRAIERGDVSGTIVYFGTPAEEILIGKPVMIQAGAFDDVDAILTWHPRWHNGASKGSCLAMDSIQFDFEGEASHAGASPEAGRSALDAVQLMNVGVEFMREHVPDDARIHYAIENAGAAPNVVDPDASVWYYIRAPSRETVERLSDRVRDVACGAAMMTQTDVQTNYRGGTYEVLSNHILSDVIEDNMGELGGFELPEEAHELAADLKSTLGDVSDEIEQLPDEYQERARDQEMLLDPLPAFDEDSVGSYSTDAGNVSHVVPVGHCVAATWPVGTPAHSWQAVAASGSIGRHAAVFVAKALAGAIYDCLAEPEIVEAARDEFRSATVDVEFSHTVPENVDRNEWIGD